jgi:alpha-1,2-mannosyltransferase
MEHRQRGGIGSGVVLAAVVGALAMAAVYLAIWGWRYGLDLRVYRDGISRWVDGHDPYIGNYTVHRLAFTYPPGSLFLLGPLDVVGYRATEIGLWVVSVGAVAVCSLLMTKGVRDRLRTDRWRACGLALCWACVAAVLLQPLRSGLDYGQIDAVVMVLVVVDVVAVPARHRGWLVGIAAAIKLTPLVFLVLFAVRREWAALVRAVGAFVAIAAVLQIGWPRTDEQFWAHALWETKRVGSLAYAGNQSLDAIIRRAGLTGAAGTVLWAAISLCVVAMVSYVLWRGLATTTVRGSVVALALAGLLVSPISWTHHWVWLAVLPPYLVLGQERPLPPVVRWGLWALVGIGIVAPYWWWSSGAAAASAEAVLPVVAWLTLAAWCVAAHRARASGRPEMATVRA